MSTVKSSDQAVRDRVARNIRNLRARARLTQENVCQLAGIAPRHLQKIEAAEVNVTLHSLVKVANALGVDIGQLFDE